MKTVHYLANHKKIVLMLLCIPVILTCCKSHAPAGKTAANEPALAPDSFSIAIARTHWTKTTFANLTGGYNLYSNKCTECHEEKLPQDFSINEWNDILPEMGKKAHLDSIQYRYVYQYILSKREEILMQKK